MRPFTRPSLHAAALLAALPFASSQKAGTFDQVANTQVSAMMMFLGNTDRVYILDKAQGNAAQISGHSAWGATYATSNHDITLMDVQTNTFCSSGMHLPNGSFAVFGGNSAVSIGGGAASGSNWDSTLQDFDGSRAIRILSPCTADQDLSSTECQWYENIADPTMSMQAQRWYSSAEALPNGTIVLMGGFTGGDILRNYPNTDPTAGASLTYEFFPSNGQPPADLLFLFNTSGLNSYPHAFLMASGKMFLQANTSTTLWDWENNVEYPLPAMPGGVVRVYPASGATAMLPMTPANNWTQTILFCGGSDMPEYDWGNFAYPFINTWLYPASTDCQRITPEGNAAYEQDDDLPVGRSMGQFIILPDGKMLVVNGGQNGTAGYGRNNSITPEDQMPWGQSFASAPVGQPALYDPNAAQGSRWTTTGFDTSSIARLYHSSALLLPDGAVLIAGSNPNLDVNTTVVPFGTEYRAEKFYPPYFSASVRPAPSGVPSTLSYGGNSFDITIPASSYSGSSNDAAANSAVNVIRPGWTTHAMNMGQRFLQLNNTYTVNSDGSIVLHVAQMPPNPNIFQPGPAFIFVVVNGIPSNGTYTLIGSGSIETQPVSDVADLPGNVLSSTASGSASGSSTGSGNTTTSSSTSHIGLIAGIAGGAAAVALVALGVGICIARRRRAKMRAGIAAGKAAQAQKFNVAPSPYQQYPRPSGADSAVFLNQDRDGWAQSHSQTGSQVWDPTQSTQGFQAYSDADMAPLRAHTPSHYPNPSGSSYSSFDNPAAMRYSDNASPGPYHQQPRY
uniref:Glyoxal oxidase n=1 Tax=Mycena chlorophos TaxID=658473 RepID=A0ABQ0LSL9_MYCCL|nr:predicted protein [Mycena chlorophos]